MSDTQSASEIQERTQEIATEIAAIEGPLLPILHAVQAEFGYVPEDALPQIADVLNLTCAEVHGVISFYHDFKTHPVGRKTLKICRAEACQAMGADALAERAKNALGIDWHETTADGAVTLEPVYCLGLCACGPAAMVNDKVIGRVSDDRLKAILAEVRA